MEMCFVLSLFIVTLCPGAALGDSVQSKESQVSGVEGGSVTFSCSYKTTDSSGVSLSWYRQSPNRAPQYILRRGTKLYSSDSENAGFAQQRFSSQADDSSTILNITALELADTAMYYCALQRAQRQSQGAELCKNPPFLPIHWPCIGERPETEVPKASQSPPSHSDRQISALSQPHVSLAGRLRAEEYG
ncbi:unnamed protein product [Eretmochelys imbricata]